MSNHELALLMSNFRPLGTFRYADAGSSLQIPALVGNLEAGERAP